MADNPLHTIFAFCRFSCTTHLKKQPFEPTQRHCHRKGTYKPIIMRTFVPSKEKQTKTDKYQH